MDRNQIIYLRNYQSKVENEKSNFRLRCEFIKENVFDQCEFIKENVLDFCEPVFLTTLVSIYVFAQSIHYNMQTNVLQNLQKEQGIEKTVNDIVSISPPGNITKFIKSGYYYAIDDYIKNNK